ncbi:MBL fold metallo-hydrolase [Saccharopolyspora shandongensis]|uniref:MBL fold metallo-hydrolase n=1 Tax=Saccharopolyspora shandongensis TaxID=418495 RepID=UPI0034077BA6
MDSVVLGNVEVTRAVELPARGSARDYIFPDVPVEHWQANENWLAPTFLDPAADQVRTMIQTWLIRSEGRTILIDTGIGNDRERPAMPSFHHLHTDYLGELAAAGVPPDDVDAVICTHVHGDHVGWNTRLTNDGEWHPTFPNAQYVISRADFDYWNPTNGHRTRAGPQMANVFEDSVAPVHQAGRTVLWEGDTTTSTPSSASSPPPATHPAPASYGCDRARTGRYSPGPAPQPAADRGARRLPRLRRRRTPRTRQPAPGPGAGRGPPGTAVPRALPRTRRSRSAARRQPVRGEGVAGLAVRFCGIPCTVGAA